MEIPAHKNLTSIKFTLGSNQNNYINAHKAIIGCTREIQTEEEASAPSCIMEHNKDYDLPIGDRKHLRIFHITMRKTIFWHQIKRYIATATRDAETRISEDG
jgi:hypothetical protein